MNLAELEMQYGLPNGMLSAIRRVESGGKNMLSDAGAIGEFQFMPATAKAYGIDPLDPGQAASGAARMMSDLGKLYKGNWNAALAHYNGGSRAGQAVASGGVAPSPETQAYVPKVIASMGGTAKTMNTKDAAKLLGLDAEPPASMNTAEAAKALGLAPGTPEHRLTMADKFARGLRDPFDAGAQILVNALPQPMVQAGNRLNNWLADNTGLVGRLPDGGVDQQVRESEQAYQAARRAQGESGIDGYRIAGNILSPANLGMMARVPQVATLAGRMGVGAFTGATSGALTPVGDGDFADEKLKQIGIGAAAGGVLPAIGTGLARIVNPNSATNTELKMLKSAGVNPTIGQTLGGMANRIEEKAQSLPILGDAIMAARARSRDEFNRAAINRASGEIGMNVENIGQSGVRDAGNAISQFYDQALSKVAGVPLDNQFQASIARLRQMATNLTPDMARKFDKTLNDTVLSRVSPQGSILGQTYKTIDSDLGTLAARYGKSGQASEQEFGDAVRQLKQLLNDQMRRSNPDVDAMLNKADAAWANLVRVEGAAKAAKNAGGVFSPAQLNAAIQAADGSVRKRAMARGTALMQDLGNAGQNVLGNRYPDSGTAGRLMLGGAGLGAGLVNPAIPAALLGSSAIYTPMAQKALTALASSRPQAAGLLADRIEQAVPFLVPASGQLGFGLLNQ